MSQFPPDAGALLDAVAGVLDEVLPEVPGDVQHRVRVAAHLTRLVAREVRHGAEAAAVERAALTDLLGADADMATLVDRLLAGGDPEFAERAWAALVDITRADLAIAKPGHTDWDAG